MLEIMLRKQFSPVLIRYFPIPLKVKYCDFSLIKSKSNLKSLVESDFSMAVKRPFKKNFVENLFINKLQLDIFEYPQLETIEEVERLKKYSQHAQTLITDEVSSENSLSKVDPKKAIATLKKHELAGFKIPKLKKGFGFLSCQYSYLQETLGIDPSLSKTVSENDEFGIQLIDSFGSEAQKEQYLEKLTTGEKISSFAHVESGTFIPFGESVLNTSAVLSSDNQSYIISGTKNWVYNAGVADLFILSAYVKNSKGEASKPTLFLIDRNTPGVVVHEPIETLGMKKLNIGNVTLNSVVVPSACILGKINEGGEIIKKILCEGRLNIGGQCLGIMRKFFSKSVKHCIHNEFFDKDKYDMDYYRIKIGEMAAKIYVVESMTYLLTGRFDSHTDPDVYLESLIVKVFSSEALQYIIKTAVDILGNEIFTSDENLCELIKDSQFYIACEDTNDHLKLVLASVGLKYAMNYRSSFVEMFSKFFHSVNPFTFFSRKLGVEKKEKAKGYLHLMFKKESQFLEDSVDILGECTRYLIRTYGKDVFHKYLELIYVADVAINIYAMVATLGRASRAYCLALQFHETDRVSTDVAIRYLSFHNQRTKLNIRKLHPLNGLSQMSSSVTNSNKYSDIYPVFKSLTVRNQNNRVRMKQ